VSNSEVFDLRPRAWRPPAPAWRTLGEVLDSRARWAPQDTAFAFFDPRQAELQSISYLELHRRACRVGAEVGRRVEPGSAALLVYPPGLDFIAAFFGCVYAAVQPAPVQLSLLPDGLSKISAVAASANAAAVLTTDKYVPRLRDSIAAPDARGSLIWLTTEADGDCARPQARATDTAFLQYSSGSTGDPKGVIITHQNILHNLHLLNAGYSVGEQDVVVSWLPHYHDLGLIAAMLQSLYSGIPAVLMSPLTFLLKPVAWLAAVSRFRATLSAGPDFAYRHCVSTIPEAQKAGLDLSSWSVAISGSEPVRADTIARFTDAYAPFGFNPRAFCPSYGLAEATRIVSGARRGAGARQMRVDADRLEHDGVAAAPCDDRPARTLVSCGPPLTTVVVVDPDTLQVREAGRAGEVLVSGPSVAPGYRNPALGAPEIFGIVLDGRPGEQFLRTGDMGLLIEGELFVTGRLKDLIIIRGRNVHAEDVETTIQGFEGEFWQGVRAAFSIEAADGEQLVIVQEVDPELVGDGDALDAATVRIKDAVALTHGVTVQEVFYILPGQIPRTSSGKVRRAECRSRFLQRQLRALNLQR
jgi:acyl-CoA synthetase (AMP-forming)/AMP-acid ligase II